MRFAWNQLSEGIRFMQGEFDDHAAFERLRETIKELDEQRGARGNHAFYLSIPPKAFDQVCRQFSKHGLAQAGGDKWRRVVIEKPFGHDLESARQMNDIVESVFPTDTVFRIDHYLGKEQCRTSWRRASLTSCSSRCETLTTLTTCRSP